MPDLDDLKLLSEQTAKLLKQDTEARLQFKGLRDSASAQLTSMWRNLEKLEADAAQLSEPTCGLYRAALAEHLARVERYSSALRRFVDNDVSEGA